MNNKPIGVDGYTDAHGPDKYVLHRDALALYESRIPKLESCWIIVVLGDGSEPDELATRTAFPDKATALRRIESYAPSHQSRCLVVHCPKGVNFID